MTGATLADQLERDRRVTSAEPAIPGLYGNVVTVEAVRVVVTGIDEQLLLRFKVDRAFTKVTYKSKSIKLYWLVLWLGTT